MRIDLNADLGEGYGPWRMGDDAALLDCVTSANVACGGHAGDPDTMAATLRLARDRGVCVGAHPGYADRQGFGRRIIPMSPDEIGSLVAAQIGALAAIARLAGTAVAYVKPHGALGNLAAADETTARAIVSTIRAVDASLAVLAISGTVLERVARDAGLAVHSEIFADRAYLSTGQLVPRQRPGAVLHDAQEACDRLRSFLRTGRMPVVDGEPIVLAADSVCVHGDNAESLRMARAVRRCLVEEGCTVASFVQR